MKVDNVMDRWRRCRLWIYEEKVCKETDQTMYCDKDVEISIRQIESEFP